MNIRLRHSVFIELCIKSILVYTSILTSFMGGREHYHVGGVGQKSCVKKVSAQLKLETIFFGPVFIIYLLHGSA